MKRSPSWWLPLLALALVVPVPALADHLAMAWESARGTPLGGAIYVAGKLWIIAIPALWFLFVERRKPSWSPAQQGGFGVAALLGLMMAGAIVITYLLARDLIDVEALRGANAANGLTTPARFFMLVIPLTLANSLLEEYVWRWFVFRQCDKLMGGVPAVMCSALLFAGHHVVALHSQTNWTITLLGSAGVLIAGCVWSWCYWRYRSIWPGYVSHIIADCGVYMVGWWMLFGS